MPSRPHMHNFPDTIQLGDAFQVRDDGWSLPGLTVEESVATPEAEAVEETDQAKPEKQKAAPLEIVPMTLREANAYVEQRHRHHGPVPGQKYSIGLSDGEKIVGVAIVGRPVSRHLDDGWTLEGKPPLYRRDKKRLFHALRGGMESGQGYGI